MLDYILPAEDWRILLRVSIATVQETDEAYMIHMSFASHQPDRLTISSVATLDYVQVPSSPVSIETASFPTPKDKEGTYPVPISITS